MTTITAAQRVFSPSAFISRIVVNFVKEETKNMDVPSQHLSLLCCSGCLKNGIASSF